MHCQILCTVFVTAILSVSLAFKADIRADTNRDGIVDLVGDSDAHDKDEWTWNRGAIFLPNIGDTDRRCSKIAVEHLDDMGDADIEACNDASDEIQRAPQYLAPLKTVPMADVPADAVGQISLDIDEIAYHNVRIFRQEGNAWVFNRANDTFSHEELKSGLELGIDARDIRRPNKWDGNVSVNFTVRSGNEGSVDQVAFHVAPLQIHHNLQAVQQVLAMEGNDSTVRGSYLNRFTHDLGAVVEQTNVPNGLRLLPQTPSPNDPDHPNLEIWTQDFVEPAYVSMPGPNSTTVSLRILIRSAQDGREMDRDLFLHHRDTGVGAVQQLGGPGRQIDSLGNLETIPPHTHNGKSYPAGRIIVGAQGNDKPYLTPLLFVQVLQDPITLDTSFLGVGHVDEFVQFLPAATPRGWVAVVNDPLAGLQMLRDVQAKGAGAQWAISRHNDTGLDPECGPYDLDDAGCESPWGVFTPTVDALLADGGMQALNEEAQRRIAENLEVLKNEIGLGEEEILRLPCLMQKHGFYREDNFKVGAFFPNVINGLVLSGRNTYVAPKPYGPIVDGQDVLAKAVTDVYAKADMTVRFV
ncbi:MAG: hypothetical protein M1821_002353 [Bathelium mastoideum]|nr:MAG: hypothetical protein M1821_002353 [Bathelium mastoideum]